MDFNKPFISFLKHLKENNASASTLKNYSHYLKEFLIFNKDSHEITPELITRFKQHLGRKGLKKETRNYYLIALRSFCSFSNVDININLDSHQRPKKNNLNEEEIQRLISFPKGKNLLRDKALLMVLIYGGLKVSQVALLNRDDSLKISEDKKEIINLYLRGRRDTDQAMFIRTKGRVKDQADDLRLSPRSIERMVEKYSKKLGLSFRVTPEVLKNSGQNSRDHRQN